ncbi:MAG: carbamoyltransferase HypF [Ginsengibacter sp.]
METYQIHINGLVQGVGFRPMVYILAKEMQLNGFVKNGSDGVHVYFNASAETAEQFFKKIINNPPQQSIITSSEIHKIKNENFSNFSIQVEDDHYKKDVLISPDNALCPNCKGELNDITNRRFRYPFITCTQCGPRYSIINKLPYERHHTSMRQFLMCEKCNDEYNHVQDRRFFSQTNSCADCGIELSLYKNASTIISNHSEEVLHSIKNYLIQGKILAIKGIGGYLFMCDANNANTIQLLRDRKHRPYKPFAVLYPGIETVSNYFELNEVEEVLLQSKESPIVLLYPKQNVLNHIAAEKIAPKLKRIGVMLPYSPLLYLIAKDYGKPLIATSANLSGSPIIYKDEDALAYLFDIADYILSYNRDIVIPEDDSVVQVSKLKNQQIILRRSRGYAPSFLGYQPKMKSPAISMGGHLKSSFTLTINGRMFVSQFLGSGENYESQQMYKDTLTHWMKLYEVEPCCLISDKHPGYFSHQYALEIAKENNCEIEFIQHHRAHFAAVLEENTLINSKQAVLGVIWDGTGLGDDGNIWGGEFFKYENNAMLRCYYFDYFPVITGDKMALEPRISALCASSETWPQTGFLREKFTESEWNNYQALITTTTLFTSSVGRIFDAVASLLNICDKQTYEGEAAMYLQAMAEEYVDENGFKMDDSYFKEGAHYYRIPTATLLQGVITDIEKNKAKNYIAAKFHYSLVSLIDIVAKNVKVEKICFSGGVFQNALLTDWIQHEYGNKYDLYFHKNLSPNDENISFGQMIYCDNNMRTINETMEKKEKEFII